MDGPERFVPRRVGQVTDELVALPWDDPADAERFRVLSRLVAALAQVDLHDREEAVIDAWAQTEAGDAQAAAALREALSTLLDGANYVPVTMDELNEAMARESLIPLRLEVDLDDYTDLLVYRRGGRRETVQVPKWKGLRSEERTITVEDRVVVLTRIKPRSWFEERGIDPAERNLVPGQVSLKQFQDVPRADIEMLLPSTQVRFRPIDTLLVGLPALASGIVVLTTKLLPTIGLAVVLLGAWLGLRDDEPELDQGALVVLFGGLVTIGGFLVRQWSKLKNRRLAYLKTLSETLYFRTLADGPGVLHTLLYSAGQQHVLEVVLAYRFLLAAPDGANAHDLDADVERWLRATCHREIDFEVDAALTELDDLGLVDRDGDRVRAVPPPTALTRLDRRWDQIFRFQPEDTHA
ncbi:MAG: DUF3754 domain-containing protein [Acidimicrobiales bacterium]|nr:DUF3754 domain-containing protein [Acidimicrobiales bacterium]